MKSIWIRAMRCVGFGLILAAMSGGSMGLRCGGDAMTAFRDEAMDEIGAGIHTIVDALIDGAIAAVDAADDVDNSTGS